MEFNREFMGKLGNSDVLLLRLKNDRGMKVAIANLGATIVNLSLPDEKCGLINVVLGYDTLQEYVADEFYIGCLVGRFAGRISGLIHADTFLVTYSNFIPTGKKQSVENSINDFRNLATIERSRPGQTVRGYNECYVLNKQVDDPAAILVDPFSKRKMTLATTAPGLVFYTGDYLGGKFAKCQGICLESEFFPDSPNQPEFPSTILNPGHVMLSQTTYQFFW